MAGLKAGIHYSLKTVTVRNRKAYGSLNACLFIETISQKQVESFQISLLFLQPLFYF